MIYDVSRADFQAAIEAAMEPTYTVRRFYLNSDDPEHRKPILTGVTLEEAQEHCNRLDTSGDDPDRGPWFDGYDKD